MPFIKVETNIGIDDPAAYTKALSALAADMLGKPESYVMAVLEADKNLFFGGTDAPAAYVTLDSIGLPEARTSDFSAAICAFLEDALKIPANRIYIAFGTIQRNLFGWDSGTF
ncbi:phenylpyruvate tautomerase MIF-related protein [Pseudodesulfovibrio portus]|uniref:L-dopachrome isomerase n=1 Tax=Pseudodesulfovibrio portus TaxID=231439 RepID=A0ABN6RTG5_9BACT|nr:phenylpyruvate tautomerase MIF-related protein [Pseudodesulfovibrio portus]BDQ33158.1 phenylpyruvate tautomerase [Pseudodesulfovibrio portus]